MHILTEVLKEIFARMRIEPIRHILCYGIWSWIKYDKEEKNNEFG